MYIMRQVPPSGYIHLMTPNTQLNYFMRFPPEDVPVWLNLFQKDGSDTGQAHQF